MTLKLYFDLMSPPSRALYIFLKATKIQFEPCIVPLGNEANLKPDFAKINRFQKLPCIEDKGFKLSESVAILRYLSKAYPIEEHWYPQDAKQQALVDEFLEWQHIGLRIPCGMYFVTKFLTPLKTGKLASPKNIEASEKRMHQALESFEKLWLKDRLYMAGNQISIADVLGACEAEQPKVAGLDPAEKHHEFKKWMQRVRNDLNPHYDNAHRFVEQFYEQQKNN